MKISNFFFNKKQGGNIMSISKTKKKNMDNNNIKESDKMEIETALKKINEANNVLHDTEAYIFETILSELKKLTGSENDLSGLIRYSQGSVLIHSNRIQQYVIKEHYPVPDKGNLYIFAKMDGTLYGFFIDLNNYAQYGGFKEKSFKKYLCNNSKYVGMTVGETAKQFNVPPVELIPFCYEPSPHKRIERCLENSKGYLESNIYSKFHGISDEDTEWWEWRAYAQGSVLAYNEAVVNFPVLEHCKRGDYLDFFVIEKDDQSKHCFIISPGYDRYTLSTLSYGTYSAESLNQCAESEFVGKPFKNVVEKYNIPFVFEIPQLFEKCVSKIF